jgi:hypothetical protein
MLSLCRERYSSVTLSHGFNFEREIANPQPQPQPKDSNTRRYHKRSITANIGNYTQSKEVGPEGDADSINLSQKSLVGGTEGRRRAGGMAENFEAKSTRRNNFFQTKSQEINRARRKGSLGVKGANEEGEKVYGSISKIGEGSHPRRGSREFESLNNVNIKNYVRGVKAKMGDGVSKTKVNFLRQKRFLNQQQPSPDPQNLTCEKKCGRDLNGYYRDYLRTEGDRLETQEKVETENFKREFCRDTTTPTEKNLRRVENQAGEENSAREKLKTDVGNRKTLQKNLDSKYIDKIEGIWKRKQNF